MGHVYPTIEQLKAYLTGGNYGTASDASLLTLLESASRSVDAFCKRGSGFGPVIETRTYTFRSRLSPTLALQADLDAIDTVTVNGEELDPEDYSQPDRRHLTGPFRRGATIEIAGSWTYPYELISPGITVTDDPLADDATTLTPSDALSIGQTYLLEEEQVQVLAITDDTATIARAQNGTTAAEHDADTPIMAFRYATEVIDGTLRIAQRRWKMRDAGLTGAFDTGLGIPLTTHQDTERSILRTTVGHLGFGFAG